MSLEKSTFAPTASGGRITFKRVNDELEIQFVDAENVVKDSATLSEDDLRTLVQESFPIKRGPKKKAAANGATRKRAAEGTSAST